MLLPSVLNTDVFPTGSMLPFAGAAAPDGWLLCYGQAISRATYGRLFALISTTYGAGNGSTTFEVPDMRGRTPIGKDDLGGVAAGRVDSNSINGANATTLGGAGGAQTNTLSTGTMPAHPHTGSSSSSGAHTHESGVDIDPAAGGTGLASGTNQYWNGTASFTTESGGAHTHIITVDSAGTGGSHSNTQPWIALSWIIKF